MKTYYSIVSIATNPKLNEKFNIGLLCVTPENTFFHFSEVKFAIVSKLLSPNGRALALSALKGMDEQINESASALGIFPNEQVETLNAVAEPYIGYLHRYNNNLVQFSSAVNIDLAIDHSVFKTLFKKYIFSEEVFDVIIKPKTRSFMKFRNQFRKDASQYANTNYDVTGDMIHGLIAPVNVDVFGKNGAFVSGQILDFSKSAANLQNEIIAYSYLTEHTLKIDKNSKSFVVGNEPSKSDKENHELWKKVMEAVFLEFVPTDESDKILSYMKENGVAPVE